MRRPPSDIDRLYLVRRLIEQRSPARALRLAVALPSEAERHVAFALIDLASGHLDRGRVTLAETAAQGARGAAELLADVEPDAAAREARFALLLMAREAALSPELPASFRDWVAADPVAAALVAGWQRIAAGEPAGVQALEAQLAGVDPRHPAFRAASRLRALARGRR